MPIQRATDTALAALTTELTRALERAPSDLMDRIAESRRSIEAGCD